MMDFLSFKQFISIPALIAFYYMGAVMFPIFMWIFSTWIMKKFILLGETHKKGKEVVWGALSTRQKFLLLGSFIMAFFFMELFWRMMFEYLIAFIQMRDALVQ
jgi:hypothetical protein